MPTSFIQYIKNNPQHYWFKRRWYGWGWVPATREGWAVLAAFIIFLIVNSFTLPGHREPSTSELVWFGARTMIAVTIIITIAFLKGEKPKWQWGPPKE